MTPLYQPIGISRSAARIAPLVLLPSVLLLLVLLLGSRTDALLLVSVTIATGWLLLLLHFLQREMALRNALRHIRPQAEMTPDPVWITAADGRVLLQNDASRASSGDIGGRHIGCYLCRISADFHGLIAELTEMAAQHGRAEVEIAESQCLSMRHTAGTSLQFWSISESCGSKDREIGRDADNALFETVPVALLRLQPDGDIVRANASARRLLSFDMPADDEAPPCLDDLLAGLGRPVRDWLEEFHSGLSEPHSELLRPRQGDAGDRYFRLCLAKIPGRPGEILGTVTDVSEMKMLEAQFVQSQKMQAIGQLAGGVAHDFNNLLTAISGHCDLLMMRCDKDDPDYADLDQISQNSNRAAALVGQLLSFSRKQKMWLERLDLRDTLADLTHLLNRLVGERVSLKIMHDPKLHPIRADRRLLEQCIMNLVVNARDAMPDGGEVVVRTENLSLNEPLSRGRIDLPKGDYVCISIRDQGTGIAPEHMDKIFEPFFTTKPMGDGTGLGLSTVYGIVRQVGGFVYATSEPGSGSCFHVYFPVLAASAEVELPPRKPREKPNMSLPSRSATILLVEDETSVRAFAARALRLKGYEVLEASSAEAALEVLSDKQLDVDVFVTDVVMPGMDGPSWVRLALEDRSDTRIVFMSGYSEDVFVEGQIPVPNAVFLAKPFTLNDFTRVVEAEVARREPGHVTTGS